MVPRVPRDLRGFRLARQSIDVRRSFFRRRRASFTKQHSSVLGAYSISRLLLLRTPSLASRLAKHARHRAALPSPSRWRGPRRPGPGEPSSSPPNVRPRVPGSFSSSWATPSSLPTLRLSKEFARLLLDASPDRLISTACRKHRGFLQRDAGCAGVATAGDEGDRRSDPDASVVKTRRETTFCSTLTRPRPQGRALYGDRELARRARRRAARLRLVLILQGRALYGDRELARRARRRGAAPRPRRGRARISRTRSNPLRGRRYALPTRGHASNMERVYYLFLKPSSGRVLTIVRRSRPRPEGPVSVHRGHV